MGKLLVKGRIRRLESGFYELFRNCKRMKRLEVFCIKLAKLYQVYEVSRKRTALGRFCLYDNKILARIKRIDMKNKVINLQGILKRFENTRVRHAILIFRELTKLYRLQQKQIKKIGALAKNIYNRNILTAFHKLAVCKKPIKNQKTSRSLSKTVKTE